MRKHIYTLDFTHNEKNYHIIIASKAEAKRLCQLNLWMVARAQIIRDDGRMFIWENANVARVK